MTDSVGSSWDSEYRRGRYAGVAPVGFVNDIIDAVRAEGLAERGLYIGCGNGRNYIPLREAGLDITGLDISAEAVRQLSLRHPASEAQLAVGTVADVRTDTKFGYVIGIQVFQHGNCDEAHQHLAQALELIGPGGLACIRVNAVGTQIEHDHTILDRSEHGGFSVRYTSGPKRDLAVHFFSRDELSELLGDFEPVLPLRLERMYREDTTNSYWEQWEGIWRRPS